MASNGEGLMGFLKGNAHVARARLGRVSGDDAYDDDNNVIVEDVGPVESDDPDRRSGIREMMVRMSSGHEIDVRRALFAGVGLVVLSAGGLLGYRTFFGGPSAPQMVARPVAAGPAVASAGSSDGEPGRGLVAPAPVGAPTRMADGSVQESGKDATGLAENQKGDALVDRGVDDADRVARDDRNAGVVSGQVVDVALSDKVDAAIGADRMPSSVDLVSFGLRSPEAAGR